MRTCEICGKTKEDTNSISFYTARALGQSRVKSGFKQHTITTSFGDFKEHTYHVCKSCTNRVSCFMPLIVFFILSVFFTIVIGVRNSTIIWNAILYIIGGFCLATIPSAVVMATFSVNERLLRKAVASRKGSSPGNQIKGYTSTTYEKIKKGSKPLGGVRLVLNGISKKVYENSLNLFIRHFLIFPVLISVEIARKYRKLDLED